MFYYLILEKRTAGGNQVSTRTVQREQPERISLRIDIYVRWYCDKGKRMKLKQAKVDW